MDGRNDDEAAPPHKVSSGSSIRSSISSDDGDSEVEQEHPDLISLSARLAAPSPPPPTPPPLLTVTTSPTPTSRHQKQQQQQQQQEHEQYEGEERRPSTPPAVVMLPATPPSTTTNVVCSGGGGGGGGGGCSKVVVVEHHKQKRDHNADGRVGKKERKKSKKERSQPEGRMNYRERRRKHKLRKMRRKLKSMKRHMQSAFPQPIVIRAPPPPQQQQQPAAAAAAAAATESKELQQLRVQLQELQSVTLKQQHAHTQLINQLEQQSRERSAALNHNVTTLAAHAAASNDQVMRALDARRLESLANKQQQQQQQGGRVIIHEPTVGGWKHSVDASTDPPPNVLTAASSTECTPLNRRVADAIVEVVRDNPSRILGRIGNDAVAYYTLNEQFPQQIAEFVRSNPNCVRALRNHGMFTDGSVKEPTELLNWVRARTVSGSRKDVNHVLSILNAPFSCYMYPLHRTRGVLHQLRKTQWREDFYMHNLRVPTLDEERKMDAQLMREDAEAALEKRNMGLPVQASVPLPSGGPASIAAEQQPTLVIKTTTDAYGNAHVQPIVDGNAYDSTAASYTVQRGDGVTEHVSEIPLPAPQPTKILLDPTATRSYLEGKHEEVERYRKNRLAQLLSKGTEYGDGNYAAEALRESMRGPCSMATTVPQLYDTLMKRM